MGKTNSAIQRPLPKWRGGGKTLDVFGLYSLWTWKLQRYNVIGHFQKQQNVDVMGPQWQCYCVIDHVV